MTRTLMNKSCAGRRSGSVLVGAMIFALVIASCLVSYLMIVQNSERTMARAQRWNWALALAEAGIEESLCALNSGSGLSSADGWVKSNNCYTVTRNFGGGSLGDGKYTVTISMNGDQTIATNYSTGTVTNRIPGDSISRSITVGAYNVGLFSVAMGAVTGITGKGNKGFYTSSWNSHDTNNIQDLNGRYNGYNGTNGDIALVSGQANMQNQNINGALYLGPGATFSGSTPPTETYSNWNGNFPDAKVPTVDPNGNDIYWLPTPAPITVGSGNNARTFIDFTNAQNNGYFLVTDNTAIQVEPGVKVTLLLHPNSSPPNWTPGNVTINGGTTNSGTIIAYQEHGTVDLGSLGGAINNRPENFIFFGLPDLTALTFGGNSTYVGVIYAPEAAITMSGGGNGFSIVGSIVGYSIYMNGHYDIHYDEGLGKLFNSGFVPRSWWEEVVNY